MNNGKRIPIIIILLVIGAILFPENSNHSSTYLSDGSVLPPRLHSTAPPEPPDPSEYFTWNVDLSKDYKWDLEFTTNDTRLSNMNAVIHLSNLEFHEPDGGSVSGSISAKLEILIDTGQIPDPMILTSVLSMGSPSGWYKDRPIDVLQQKNNTFFWNYRLGNYFLPSDDRFWEKFQNRNDIDYAVFDGLYNISYQISIDLDVLKAESFEQFHYKKSTGILQYADMFMQYHANETYYYHFIVKNSENTNKSNLISFNPIIFYLTVILSQIVIRTRRKFRDK